MKRRAVALLPLALAGIGCYTYAPLATPDPAPGTKVALVLSDQGRVGMGPSVGQGAARVEGAVVGSSDTAYVLSVSDVYGINGRREFPATALLPWAYAHRRGGRGCCGRGLLSDTEPARPWWR